MRSVGSTTPSRLPEQVLLTSYGDRLRRRGHARRRNGTRMAGACRQARPQVRAGSRRGSLSHPVSLRRLVVLTLAMVGGRLGLLSRCRGASSSELTVAHRRVMPVVPGLVLSAVAAHVVVS